MRLYSAHPLFHSKLAQRQHLPVPRQFFPPLFFLFYRAVPRKPNISEKMTNLASGQKRSWDGVENDMNKRPRDRDELVDWRDVHLRSASTKSSTRPDNYDTRNTHRYDGGRHGAPGRRKRGADNRHSNDNQDKSSREDHRKGDRRTRSPRRMHTPSRRERSPSIGRRADDEKEEGE